MRNFSKRMFSVSLTCSLFVLSFCFLTGCSSNTTASNGSSPLGSAPDDASSETIAQNISGCLPELSKEDLIAQSTLIATGTVTEVSDAFQIAPVGGGDPSVFTDYFFTVSDVLRGEPDDNVVSVRIQGGTANGMSSTAELEPQLEVGKSYLLFLYQPNMGGSYNTKGDYYYVTGLYRGAYELDTSTAAPASLDDAASTFSSAEVAEDDAGLPSTWSLADAAATIDAVSQEHPVNENGSYEQSVEAWEGNLASGFITQEEYDRFVQEAQTYAQIID